MLVDLTPSQVMALGDILLAYTMTPGHIEVFVDVVHQVETRPEDLLRLFVDVGAGLHAVLHTPARLQQTILEMRSAVALSRQFNTPVADAQLVLDWAEQFEFGSKSGS